MALGLGFSMEQAGAGADALRKMMTTSSAIEADNSANKLAVEQNKGISDYMKAEKDSVTLSPATAAGGLGSLVKGEQPDPGAMSGKAVYGIVQMQQDMQKQQQELASEEQRVKLLPPQLKAQQEATLTRKQNSIDHLQAKLLDASEKQLGETYSVLDAINSPDDYNRAKAYFGRQYETMADEAGITDDKQKQKFVQDHVEKTLGKTYDQKGLDIKKNGMLSVQDQINFKKLDVQMKGIEKQIELGLARDKVMARQYQAKYNSDEAKLLNGGLQDLEKNIYNNNLQAKELDDQIKDIEKQTPAKKVGGFMGFGQKDNPEYSALQDRIEETKKKRDELLSRTKESERMRPLFLKRISELSGTDKLIPDDLPPVEKPVETKKTDLGLDKYDSSVSGKSSSQVFSEYQKAYPKATPQQILEAAIKNGDLKGK